MDSKIVIASKLISVAERILASDYRYDPEHRHKPKSGNWHKTEKGWSNAEKRKVREGKKQGGGVLKRNVELAESSESPEELDHLSRSRSPKVRYNVAKNESTSPETLARLARDKNEDVKGVVARNRNTPVEVLEMLDDDEDVRDNIAWNENAPRYILNSLASTGSTFARCGVASNPSTPKRTLMKLAYDDDGYVKVNLADNERTPKKALNILSMDEDDDVRLAVANNPSASDRTLRRLARHDENEEVSETAATSLSGRRNRVSLRDSLKKFKKSLGPRGQGRDVNRLKQDFIRNMDPSKYDSPEAFSEARGRIMRMSPQEFDYVLGHILKDDDDEGLSVLLD